MAEVFLSAFLPTVFDKLAQALLQYGKLGGVEKQLQELESKLRAIRAVLQDAEEKQAKDMALRDWLTKLEDAAYDAEDVLDELHTEAMREAVNSKVQKRRLREAMQEGRRRVLATHFQHPRLVYRRVKKPLLA